MRDLKAEISVYKIIKWAIAVFVLVIVIGFLVKVNISRAGDFLPNFGNPDEDKVIEMPSDSGVISKTIEGKTEGYKDYTFYLKIGGKDVTNLDTISLEEGKKYNFVFGYKVQGEKAEGIRMYYLRIKDSDGNIVKEEKEEPYFTGSGDEESFSWKTKSGAFSIELVFSKKGDVQEDIVKVIEKKLVI